MGRRYCAVETVLDIYDPNRLWYTLMPCGFNGYEISNDGYIRSMKHRIAYPYGIMITPLKKKDGTIQSPEDPIFELTNNDCIRERVHFSRLKELVKRCDRQVSGYPKYTYVGDGNPRYNRSFKQHNGQRSRMVMQDKDHKIPNFVNSNG